MKALHLNHNGFFEFCKGYSESKTIKFPFIFLWPPETKGSNKGVRPLCFVLFPQDLANWKNKNVEL